MQPLVNEENNDQSLLDLIEVFEWAHGRKHIVHGNLTSNIPYWANIWFPGDNTEVTLLLSAPLGAHAYDWIKFMLKSYYLNPLLGKKYLDPLLSGISLSPISSLPFSKKPAILFGENKPKLFLCKNIGEYGTLFFPRNWLNFISWFHAGNNRTDEYEKEQASKPLLTFKDPLPKWVALFNKRHGYYFLHWNSLLPLIQKGKQNTIDENGDEKEKGGFDWEAPDVNELFLLNERGLPIKSPVFLGS